MTASASMLAMTRKRPQRIAHVPALGQRQPLVGHLSVRRVLLGGRFYHSDMLRPGNPVVEKLYYAYLRLCLRFTSFLFRSGPAAFNCKEYFIQALQMFYSAQELSDMLEDVGFRDVTGRRAF